ncbi:hypothetical protein E2320_018042, partial [Naja naja]
MHSKQWWPQTWKQRSKAEAAAQAEGKQQQGTKESGNSEVILMILDLASLNSCELETFLASEPRLDILIKCSGNSEVILMILDLASLNSVRAFAQTFLASEPRLDILINNAGPVRTQAGYSSSRWLFWLLYLSEGLKQDCDTGAQTSIYCATEEGIESLSGRYFADCRLLEP